MKFSAKKDNRKRALHKKYELNKNVAKVLLLEGSITAQNLCWLNKSFSKVTIKNRCTITARAKGNLRFFKSSRMKLKENASFGYLEGVRRSSW